MACPYQKAKRNEKSIRQVLFWTLTDMQDVDEMSPAAIDVVENYRPLWFTIDDFRNVLHDKEAIRMWINERAA